MKHRAAPSCWTRTAILEAMCVSRDLLNLKNTLAVRFSQMAYNGFWYCEEMDALMAFLESSQKHVTGRVHLELYKGNVIVVGRESEHTLYDEDIASMEDDGGAYDQTVTGFIGRRPSEHTPADAPSWASMEDENGEAPKKRFGFFVNCEKRLWSRRAYSL